MSNSSAQTASAAQEQAQTATKTRKAYHTPTMENYGAVSELTRSSIPNPYLFDGQVGYNASVG